MFNKNIILGILGKIRLAFLRGNFFAFSEKYNGQFVILPRVGYYKVLYTNITNLLKKKNHIPNRKEKERLKIQNKLLSLIHLGPDNSTACKFSVESTIQSEVGCGASSTSCRSTSTFCHSSHFSAKPSPSNILTTSDILGRSMGEL